MINYNRPSTRIKTRVKKADDFGKQMRSDQFRYHSARFDLKFD